MTTIVLADDHQIVRDGLRAILIAEPGFKLVGEASDGLEAVRLVGQLRPDVVVVDLQMPNLGGLEATRQIKKASSKTQVIILSMHANEGYVSEALKNGAMAYVLKDSPSGELVRAIKEVAAGRRYLSPPLSDKSIEEYLQKTESSTLDTYEILTNREREVLQMVAEGHTSAEIAAKLFISPRTVELHRANLMRKLDLRNQADLIRYAIRRGLIHGES
jgi:two-component system, NarL family, response regulator NreC